MKPQTLLNRHDFIARVNAWTERHGAPSITSRMLEDWNEEGIFAPGIPMSCGDSGTPIRFYNWRHYFRALLISRLKMQDRSRYSELRSILWFRGIEIPGGPPRNDLVVEYARSVKSLLRSINSTYIPTHDKNENQNRVKRLRKQMGEQAPVFRDTFLEAEDDWVLAGYREGRFSEPQDAFREFGKTATDRLFLEWGVGCDGVPIFGWLSGLIAHPGEGENSGVTLIENASDHELNQAREMLWAFLCTPSLLDSLRGVIPDGQLKLTQELSIQISALKKSIVQIPAWRPFLLVISLASGKCAPDLLNQLCFTISQ